jgi:hypothetical protein
MFDNTMKARRAKSESWRALARSTVVAAALWPAVAALAVASDDPAKLPEGAIQTDEGVYHVPIGRDEEGCMMYRMHAPGRDVVQVIFYRRADGSFTMAKPEAACEDDGK